jgi:hypothetical protein
VACRISSFDPHKTEGAIFDGHEALKEIHTKEISSNQEAGTPL